MPYVGHFIIKYTIIHQFKIFRHNNQTINSLRYINQTVLYNRQQFVKSIYINNVINYINYNNINNNWDLLPD